MSTVDSRVTSWNAAERPEYGISRAPDTLPKRTKRSRPGSLVPAPHHETRPIYDDDNFEPLNLRELADSVDEIFNYTFPAVRAFADKTDPGKNFPPQLPHSFVPINETPHGNRTPHQIRPDAPAQLMSLGPQRQPQKFNTDSDIITGHVVVPALHPFKSKYPDAKISYDRNTKEYICMSSPCDKFEKPRTFKELKQFNRHFRAAHLNLRPHKCDYCSRMFARNDVRVKHMNTSCPGRLIKRPPEEERVEVTDEITIDET